MTMPCRLDATQGSEADSMIPESLVVYASRYQHALWPDAGILDELRSLLPHLIQVLYETMNIFFKLHYRLNRAVVHVYIFKS